MFSASQIAEVSNQFLFKSISPEQIDETASFVCMLVQIHKNEELIKKFLDGHGQKMDVVNLVFGL